MTIEKISNSELVSMHDDWFEIADQNHFWMQWRWNSLLKSEKYLPKKNETYLEIGCGNGIAVDQFENNLSCIIDGCDLNEKALLLSKKSTGRKFLYNIFDQNKDFVHRYDGLILLDVIEHIKDDISFLKVAALHSKVGGKIIINVPAYQWLYSDYDKAVGHIRRYSAKDLRQLFKDTGLEEVKIYYWGALLIPIAIIRKFIIAGRGEDIIKAGFKPSSKLENFILTSLMKIESLLPFTFPFGTSLIAIAKVKN